MIGNIHAKYQSFSTHCSKVISKVQVYDRNIESQTDDRTMITIFYLLLQRDIIHHINKHYQIKLMPNLVNFDQNNSGEVNNIFLPFSKYVPYERLWPFI